MDSSSDPGWRPVAERFALRHRRKLRAALKRGGLLLVISILILGLTVGVPHLLQWDTLVPAAIGLAIGGLLLFSTVVMLPLELIAYVGVYFDRPLTNRPFSGLGFGRALYRESGRLDALANEAGLPRLSSFEAPDVLDTGGKPEWHQPDAALPTVEYLLRRVEPGRRLRRDLESLRVELVLAREQGAQFYLLLLTWSGVTNAHVEALRRGEDV